MSRMRVLVCGANYGRTYLAALARQPRKYELAGILAQGSLRSHEVAAVNDVPLYRSAGEVPDDIDLACAAMSSSAFPVVLQLMRRGMHVLCEHPLPARALQKALSLAGKHNLQFHVNGHFANLPAPAAFIRASRRTSKLDNPELVEIMTTERALYATLDILMGAVGASHSLQSGVLSRWSRFVFLEGRLGRIPLWIAVQVSGKGGRRLADGSPAYLLDQRLAVVYPTGVLTLLATAGPVLWNRNPAQMLASKGPLSTVLSGPDSQTAADLREHRVQANIEALNSIRKSILGNGTPPAQQPQHILRVSKAWESIGRQLYPS
jgi:thiazolinyl reductase component of yersiniabactin synthetase